MKGILSSHAEFVIVGDFARASDLCARTSYYRDEIMVFADPLDDLSEAMLRELGIRFPPLKIILITRSDGMSRFFAEARFSALGLLGSTSDASCFPDAIRTVSAGNAYVSVEMLRMLTRVTKPTSVSGIHETLSHREFEIFTRIVSGKNNTVIGFELDISSKTVSTHKARLMEKLGLDTVPQLVQYALENGLIDMAGIGRTDAHGSHGHLSNC